MLDVFANRDGVLTAQDSSTTPDSSQGRCEGVASVCGHGRLGDLKRLAESRDFEPAITLIHASAKRGLGEKDAHVQPSPKQQIAELDGLLLRHLWLGSY